MYLRATDPPLPRRACRASGARRDITLAGLLGATVDLDRAVEENRRWSQKLGWKKHRADIIKRVLHVTRNGISVSDTDDRTLARAVADWQQRLCFRRADGILARTTWTEMRIFLGLPADNRPVTGTREIDAVLPRAGFGYCGRKYASLRWGLPETIEALELIGIAWYVRDPTGPRIQIRDIGRRGGGPLPPHKSHRIGLDVDIDLIRSDGREEPVDFKRRPKLYSRSRTQELVDTIRGNTVLQVTKIFLDDPEVRGVRKDKHSRHTDHMHVRFCIPARYPKLKEKGFERCT